MNCFTWFTENYDWIVTEDQYNEEFKNLRGPIHNGQFRSYILKEKINIKEICSMYAGSSKLIGFIRDRKPEILINCYKDQFNEYIIRNGMWYVLSLQNQKNFVNK